MDAEVTPPPVWPHGPIDRGTAVEVAWRDAETQADEWTPQEDVDVTSPVIRTVAQFFKVTPTTLVLFSDLDTRNDQVHTVLRIPVPCIEAVYVLRRRKADR